MFGVCSGEDEKPQLRPIFIQCYKKNKNNPWKKSWGSTDLVFKKHLNSKETASKVSVGGKICKMYLQHEVGSDLIRRSLYL